MEDKINSIKILNIRYLENINVWNYSNTLEILIDIGDFINIPSNLIPGFTENLINCIPSIKFHRCSEGKYGGFINRLNEGTLIGHILEHILIEISLWTVYWKASGKTRESKFPNSYLISYIFSYSSMNF